MPYGPQKGHGRAVGVAARFRPRIAGLAIFVLAGGMPSLEHAALVEMFRTNPRLLPYLLREVFHMPVPEALTITIAEAALDQVKPIEFRADLVLELRDPNQGSPQLAAILEVQLGPDEDKRYSWPAYLILGSTRSTTRTPRSFFISSTRRWASPCARP